MNLDPRDFLLLLNGLSPIAEEDENDESYPVADEYDADDTHKMTFMSKDITSMTPMTSLPPMTSFAELNNSSTVAEDVPSTSSHEPVSGVSLGRTSLLSRTHNNSSRTEITSTQRPSQVSVIQERSSVNDNYSDIGSGQRLSRTTGNHTSAVNGTISNDSTTADKHGASSVNEIPLRNNELAVSDQSSHMVNRHQQSDTRINKLQRSSETRDHLTSADNITTLVDAQWTDRIKSFRSDERSSIEQSHPPKSEKPLKRPKPATEIRKYLSDSDTPRGITTQRSNRMLNLQQSVIESRSGRKLEGTEVIKQKYINSEIQDIPRRVDGPIKYGHLHRSMSSHMSLGSLDIRSQINRLRYKLGPSLFPQKEAKKNFRCQKFDIVPPVKKSVVKLLYGDVIGVDDPDPELSNLFDDIMDECDNNFCRCTSTKKEAHVEEAATENESLEKSGDYVFQSVNNKEAFLRGFVQGLYHGTSKSKNQAAKLDAAIQQAPKGTDPPSKDPLVEETSHEDMIRTNQDKTHKSLKEWEMEFRSTSGERMDSKNHKDRSTPNQYCFVCKEYEARSRNENTEEYPRTTQHHEDPRPPILTPSSTLDKQRTPEPRFLAPLTVVPKVKQQKNPPIVNDVMKQKQGTEETTGISRTSKKRQKKRPKIKTVAKDISDNALGPINITPISTEKLHIAESDPDISIITLAKQKLENKRMSSLFLENIQRRVCDKAPSRQIMLSPVSPMRSKERNIDTKSNRSRDTTTPMKEKDTKPPAPVMVPVCSLEGWMTETIKFCDENEALHMSTPELLHPVESQETIEPSNSASSTVSFSKRANPSSTNQTLGTPTHAKLSDLDGGKSDTKYETKAFKSKSRLIDSYKKASELAKLRLTKSCDVSLEKNKILANTPLSRCISYNIEQKLQSQVQVTASINLSERLAKHLKDMGKDRDTQHRELRKMKTSVSSTKQGSFKCQTPDEMRGVDGQSVDKTEYVYNQHNRNWLDIHDAAGMMDTSDVHAKGQKHIGTNNPHRGDKGIELPPISIKGLISKQQEVTSMTKISEESADDYNNIWRGGGVAVRAESCVSPYNFDKSNPNKIHLKASSLSRMHAICTQCGCVNEMADNTSGHERINKHSRKSTVGVNRAIGVHEHCCSPRNDEKWKLEQVLSEQAMDLPKVNVSKISHNVESLSNVKQLSMNTLEEEKHCIRIPSSQPIKAALPKTEEMSFNFLDQNIKLKFQCDVSMEQARVESKKDSSISSFPTSKRLDQIATPLNREKLECPIAKETRIYKDKERNRRKLDVPVLSEIRLSSPGSPSPYLDYLKRKAAMKSMRASQILQDSNDNGSDIDVYTPRSQTAKQKRFPVIPIKKKHGNGFQKQKHSIQRSIAESFPKNLFIGPTNLSPLYADNNNNSYVPTQYSMMLFNRRCVRKRRNS